MHLTTNHMSLSSTQLTTQWMRTTLKPQFVNITTKLGVTNMMNIIYAIGFTAGFLICAFLGWSDNYSTLLTNLMLMFSGFCAGGMAICIFENWDN